MLEFFCILKGENQRITKKLTHLHEQRYNKDLISPNPKMHCLS